MFQMIPKFPKTSQNVQTVDIRQYTVDNRNVTKEKMSPRLKYQQN